MVALTSCDHLHPVLHGFQESLRLRVANVCYLVWLGGPYYVENKSQLVHEILNGSRRGAAGQEAKHTREEGEGESG